MCIHEQRGNVSCFLRATQIFVLSPVVSPFGAITIARAVQAGLPNLREYIVNRHVVLYTHTEAEVELLSLKHQRDAQLVFA